MIPSNAWVVPRKSSLSMRKLGQVVAEYASRAVTSLTYISSTSTFRPWTYVRKKPQLTRRHVEARERVALAIQAVAVAPAGVSPVLEG